MIKTISFYTLIFSGLFFLEGVRILKPGGLFNINVPSNGSFHRYPVDCWRFFPDSGKALERWAQRNGYKTVMLESFVGLPQGAIWQDFVAVYVKDSDKIELYPHRILESGIGHINGLKHGTEIISNQNWSMHPQTSIWNSFVSLIRAIRDKVRSILHKS